MIEVQYVLQTQHPSRLFQRQRVDHISKAGIGVIALGLEQQTLRQHHIDNVAGADFSAHRCGVQRTL